MGSGFNRDLKYDSVCGAAVLVSRNGIVVGSVELRGGRFVPVDLSGEVVGNFATLHDARAALLAQRR